MKKKLKIILFILGFLLGIVVLDTLQAKIFDNSPLLKVRKFSYDDITSYIDKGLFVNHYFCNNYEKTTVWKNTKYACSLEDSGVNDDLFQCLENNLNDYLTIENSNLVEIPLSEIKKSDSNKIAYYRGVYVEKNPTNMYVMVYPKNGTYEFNVMKDFNKYFYEKFFLYQTYESPLTPTIYVHSQNNDIDFNDILNKCLVRNNTSDSESIPSKTLDKINNTTKIVIKFGENELGIIKDKDKLTKILNIISNSKKNGEVCLSDRHAFDFEMYDNNNKLIDTIYVWGDGKRLIPSSINGCYYSTSKADDLRNFIEEETEYVFYDILNFGDSEEQNEQLIYKDDNNSYYVKSDDTNEILIKFMLKNQVMTLKYALENKYISVQKVFDEYPDILIRK